VGLLFRQGDEIISDLILVSVLIICLVTDVLYQKIYNIISVPGFLAGLAFNTIVNGWAGLSLSLWGTALGLGLLIFPFALGYLGAGDVKLLAVIGTIKGYLFVIYTTVIMSLAGGVIGILILIYHRRLAATLLRFWRGLVTMVITGFKVVDFGSDQEKTMFPYAIAIVIGAVGAMWWMR